MTTPQSALPATGRLLKLHMPTPEPGPPPSPPPPPQPGPTPAPPAVRDPTLPGEDLPRIDPDDPASPPVQAAGLVA